jgi:hypothetical protein
MRARREIGGSLISFLDVMCCGFGAVILLVVVLNSQVLTKREQQAANVRAELARMAALESFARDELTRLKSDVATVEAQQAETAHRADELRQRIRDTTRQAQELQSRAQAAQSSLAATQAQSAAMAEAVSLLRAKASQQWEGGKRPVGFTGDGQRQYLTGLKLGGERTLILLDSSASMLDETIVNVVRWKLMPPETRRGAPKWQRSVRTVHWLLANLRPGKQYQVVAFNTEAAALIAGTDGRWLSTDDAAQINAVLTAARAVAPTGGTSLHRAFAVIDRMSPPPDSVILITDGLPTQGGRIETSDRLISEDERRALFTDAVRGLRKGIPVNTLLLPMEGDPSAAAAFWQLAIMTQGSFITPSGDWP